MPGFMPGIHVFGLRKEGVDGRDLRREDGASRLLPDHDEFAALYTFLINPPRFPNRISSPPSSHMGIDGF
jgi:hypothetical protein